jgi:hypothetical protein
VRQQDNVWHFISTPAACVNKIMSGILFGISLGKKPPCGRRAPAKLRIAKGGGVS